MPARAALNYPSLDPAATETLVAEALTEADRLVEVALTMPADDIPGFLDGLDAAMRVWAAANGRTAHPRMLDPDPERRRAAEVAFARLEHWRRALVRREDVAARIVRADAARDSLDGEQRAAVTFWKSDLRDAGAGLSPEVGSDVRAMQERLIELSTDFTRRLGMPPDLEVPADRLTGLSDQVRAGLVPGQEPGTLRLPMSDPVCQAVLVQVQDRGIRERVGCGGLNRGGDANREMLAEAAQIRRALASRLGYRSWADLRTETQLAGGASAVTDFLADVSGELAPIVDEELEAMRRVLAAELGVTPDAVEIEDWDWRYADGRQRAAVGADPDAVRDYFAYEDVFSGMISVIDDMFGVRLEPRTDRVAWHPDVRTFDLLDTADGSVLAALLVDPYQRDGKANGAWMDTLDPSTPNPGRPRFPVFVLCANFTPPADGEALLTMSDVGTLFHEYGHVVHLALSLAHSRYWIASESWVRRDWVEAPSQFLGRWGTEPAVLARFAHHRRTGAPIPAELLAGLDRADRLNGAIRALRQVSIATRDQAIHGVDDVDVDTANWTGWAVRRTPFPDGTFEPGSHSHEMEGYDGLYYGYPWAEVLSDDLMTPFVEAGLLSREVGARYRREVLEQPAVINPLDGVRRFLGRDPSSEAYFARRRTSRR